MHEFEVNFNRTPGGYVADFSEVGVVIEARNVRWEHGSLYAVTNVKTRMPGVKTIRGVVTEVRANLSGERGRAEIAKACQMRGPEVDLDWRGLLEDFSIRVLAAEREGRPFQLVGNLPPRIDPGFTVRPILPAGKVAFLYGPGSATKGYLAAALCVSVELGAEIVPGMIPAARGRALYLDWESDQYDLDARVRAVARGVGLLKAPEVGYRECFGPLTEQIDDVEREIHRTGVTLLVIDSVGMALSTAREGGDANESTIRMFSALRRLNVTTLAIDHVVGAEVAKNGRSPRPYGSVYKVNLARNTYELRALPKDENEPGVRHVTLVHRKANSTDYISDRAWAVVFEGPDFGFADAVHWTHEEPRPVREEVDTDSTWPASLRSRIRELLERGHLSESELADELGRKQDSIARVLRRYSGKAADPTNRWFNRLASGKWEALPLAPVEVSDAG